MTAPEIIESLFIKENGYQPANIIASDHFALGCMLIIEGKIDAGLKIISGALSLAGCKNAAHEKQIRAYAGKNPAEAALMVKPHYEIEKLIKQ
ncbi:MAG: hypothetical protein CVV42_17345 [Candidatus Riflebacteria bacterium HGW-Riflebacteria-2]|jgi:hypothetical protein|nr:MAG: hypothetical protein CVV42_17345 [Candidatus Riflebacteria bacterium HGW-Riflebacteria-2]